MYTNTLGIFVVSLGTVSSVVVPVLGLPIKWHFDDFPGESGNAIASSINDAPDGLSIGHQFVRREKAAPLHLTQGTTNFEGLFNPDGSINGDVLDLLGADLSGSRFTKPPVTGATRRGYSRARDVLDRERSFSRRFDTLAPLEFGVHPSTINNERRQTPPTTVLMPEDTRFDSLINPDGTINSGELGLLEGVHMDPSVTKGAPKRRQDVPAAQITSPTEQDSSGDPGYDTSRSQEEEQPIAPTRSENTPRHDIYGLSKAPAAAMVGFLGPDGSINPSASRLDGIISGVSNTYGRDLATTRSILRRFGSELLPDGTLTFSPDLVSLLNSTTDGFPGGGLAGIHLVIPSPAEQSGTTLHQAGRMTTTTTAARQSLSKRENSTEIEASMQSLTQLLKSLQAPTTHS